MKVELPSRIFKYVELSLGGKLRFGGTRGTANHHRAIAMQSPKNCAEQIASSLEFATRNVCSH